MSQDQPASPVPAAASPRRRRLERLCQLMALLSAVWAAVMVARAFRPSSPLALAREAIAEGQWAIAVDAYLGHLATNPRDWPVRLELSLLLAEMDRSQALIELRTIPADAREYPDALRRVVDVCLVSERYKEAKDALLALEALDRDDWWVLISLAEVFFRDGDLQLALHYAQRCAEVNPEYTRAHFLISEIYDDLRRPADMIAPLRRVIELQPENYAAHLNLCYAYSKAGQPAPTRKEAEWCLARNANDVDARRLLATAARDEGQTAEATRQIEQALKLAPQDLNCRLLEGELLLFERQAEKALERLQPLYETYKNDRRLVALLSRAATSAGRQKEAEEYREQVRKLSGR